MSRRDYSRGANRTGYNGGTLYSTGFGFKARSGVNFCCDLTAHPRDRNKPKLPRRVAKALGTAKGLMGGEKARLKKSAEAAQRRAAAVPAKCKRIVRVDPDTGIRNVVDIKVDQRTLGLIMVRKVRPASIPDWQIEFILTGRLPNNDGL